ncbi:hypothetical protein LY76DRAFT_673777 [Colletotrichum caudatum]|nr:hypothetical protein LY76DRAFT_673777 [Colletotrichum caudatum]
MVNVLRLRHKPVDVANSKAWTRTFVYAATSALQPERTSNRLTSSKVAYYTKRYGYEGKARSIRDQVQKMTEQAIRTGKEPRVLKETIYSRQVDIQVSYNGQGKTSTSISTSVIKASAMHIALIETTTPGQGHAGKEDDSPPLPPLFRWQTGHGMETDDRGNLVSYKEYSPFSTTIYMATGQKIQVPSRYQYATYRRKYKTGLYYCQARFYAPWIYHWISADPLGLVNRTNLYAYYQDDPVNNRDPTGTRTQSSSCLALIQQTAKKIGRRAGSSQPSPLPGYSSSSQ